MTKATGSLKPIKWDETPFESPEKQMARVSTLFEITGEITGQAKIEYLMFYSHMDPKDMHNAIATYVGLSRVTATIGGKTGSFALEDRGTFDKGVANSTLRILDNSGTDAFAGIAGGGYYSAGPEANRIELEFELPAS